MAPFELRGATAVVTGAARGIGAALARVLAERGCALALVDRLDDELRETADRCRRWSVPASVHVCDVTDPEAVAGTVADILARHHRPNLLVNNAGIALVGRFDQIAQSEMEEVFAVNFWAAVRMTRLLLPRLHEARQAQIVNVGSIYGMIAPPGHLTYAASKFALRGFTEALAHELRGSRVGVTLVCPGHVRTAMAAQARRGEGVTAEAAQASIERFARMMRIDADDAAGVIADGIRRRAGRVLVGRDARLVALVTRLLPVSYWPVVERHADRLMAERPRGGPPAGPRGA